MSDPYDSRTHDDMGELLCAVDDHASLPRATVQVVSLSPETLAHGAAAKRRLLDADKHRLTLLMCALGEIKPREMATDEADAVSREAAGRIAEIINYIYQECKKL